LLPFLQQLITTIGLEFPVFDREEMEEQMFMETLKRYKNRKEKDRNFHNIMVLAADLEQENLE